MPPFCFTCERERTREFACRACGDRECALCVDANAGLCEACSFELQSAATLQRFFAVGDAEGEAKLSGRR
jgi:hypothetical protein